MGRNSFAIPCSSLKHQLHPNLVPHEDEEFILKNKCRKYLIESGSDIT